MADGAVDARGIKIFAKQMRAADRRLGVAVAAELRDIGNEIRDEIRAGTDAPYDSTGANDSQGKAARKRRSVKTSVRRGGVSLYSREPDAGVWNWGGTISPRGVPIHIPRTEFVKGPVLRHAESTEARVLGVLSGVARRYAEFT